jgi:hypothetical protein
VALVGFLNRGEVTWQILLSMVGATRGEVTWRKAGHPNEGRQVRLNPHHIDSHNLVLYR